MKWIATAEHCNGKSVSHPCTKGVYPDPTDDFQTTIEGMRREAAQDEAQARLLEIVRHVKPCDCSRQLEPGSDAWWNSVQEHVWPQDVEAYAEWIRADGVPFNDPYGLLPDDLRMRIEATDTGFSAYVPGVPGCVATGETETRCHLNLLEALELHFAND